jgi:N-acetyl-anhydromuramyl-L-alanine amidase AmpD
MTNRRKWAAATTVAALVGSGFAALAAAPQAQAADWSRCLSGPADRQAAFARAAQVSGVPEKVLLAVSYMESRWDDHGGAVSSSGGYGVMHLTQDAAAKHEAEVARQKGDGSKADGRIEGTLSRAADLTGFSTKQLRSDDVANLCGGAAVLASYQRGTGSQRPAAWSKAIGHYSGSADGAQQVQFARQVFRTLRNGEARTTNDGQRVALAPTPTASLDTAAVSPSAKVSNGDNFLDCPAVLKCNSIPAPYAQYGSTPGAYGNYDLANRPKGHLTLDYIVIHDTEADYPTTIKLVQDPTYLGWHYTIRSNDGRVAQHINPRNVGWHAGNWYVNMHSIGIEHEGFAATGSKWYTESMYESSATLVRYLAKEYRIPLDRAHIIGHDQVPGTTQASVPGMHWDPGPYWDWEHYFTLLGKPIVGDRKAKGDVVVVKPGFATNQQTVTHCDDDAATDDTCPAQGSNFVYLRQSPSDTAPLVNDPSMHPNSTASTTDVADIGARAAAGQKLVVAARQGSWLGVWWLGQLAWLKNADAAGRPVVAPTTAKLVRSTGAEAPVYGRAYPESSAYPSDIPDQGVATLGYTLKPGQAYALADKKVTTDYYYAKTFDDSLAGDHTDVVGRDRYYQIWLGHRIAYVRAADVKISKR